MVVAWSTHLQWVGRYLGPTRNGVADLGCDLELVHIEAELSRGRRPGLDVVLTCSGQYIPGSF